MSIQHIYEIGAIAAAIAILIIFLLVRAILREKKQHKSEILKLKEEYRLICENVQKTASDNIEAAKQSADVKICEEQKLCQKLIEEEKQRSLIALRTERERIDAEKSALEALSEKELMIRILMGIGGYATRLDRIEIKQEALTKELSAEASESAARMFASFEIKFEQISKNVIEAFNNAQENTDLGKLTEMLSSVSDEVDSIGWRVRSIDDNTNSIQSDLGSIQSNISSIQSDVSSIQSDVSSIQSDVSSIQSDVSSIHYS